jgi:Holliday junction resolvasome RuvABC endonuclease subunit
MTEPLRILALDLMTTTGWAISDSKGLILSGSQCFKPQRFEGGGMRYLRFARWLDEMLESGVDWVVFEEVRAHRGTDAAHIYGGFMAALTSRCEALSLPYTGVPVGTIKTHATGKGNAPKSAVIAAMRALGHRPVDDNEADALALLHWAIETPFGTPRPGK